METLKRREFLGLVGAVAIEQSVMPARVDAQTGSPGFYVCMHQVSSAGFDFRTAMEGYAKAGVKSVEVFMPRLREFVAKESPAAATRLVGDLGLKLTSCAGAQPGLAEPTPDRAKNIEGLKGFLELAQSVGLDRMVVPSLTTEPFTPDDYKRGADNLREVGEIARPFGVTMMFEFVRATTFAASLPTALKLVREANHPNLRLIIDTYHLWGGLSKLEDLELLRDGELFHLHFEDVPTDPPREMLQNTQRVFPGEGDAPLRSMLEIMKRKKYTGPVSVEMFDPAIQATDPYQVAMKARATVEPLFV